MVVPPPALLVHLVEHALGMGEVTGSRPVEGFMTYDEIRAAYRIFTVRGKYGNDWVVMLKRNGRIMTSGSVFHCCRWVTVWGNVRM